MTDLKQNKQTTTNKHSVRPGLIIALYMCVYLYIYEKNEQGGIRTRSEQPNEIGGAATSFIQSGAGLRIWRSSVEIPVFPLLFTFISSKS